MSYDSVIGHRSMALDTVRNEAYRRALAEVITPESVVLDLGAGLGTLGLLAAQLGARRVHLVEPSDVATVTRQIVQANGLQDRVQVHQGRIEDVELPGSVSVITSVMTGNFLLAEDLLPTLFHARDRYLEPGGTLLPSAAVMRVQPVTASDFHAKHIGVWEQPHLGLDVRMGLPYAVNSLYWGRRELEDAVALAPAADLLALDFRSAHDTHCESRAEFCADAEGVLHGWLGWFRMALGDTWISTGPASEPMHWRMAFLPLVEPVAVSPGDALAFELLRPPAGDWTWTSRVRGRAQRQSTFFSNPTGLAALQALDENATPDRSERAEGLRVVLEAMDGRRSLAALATLLREAAPTSFPTSEAALAEVRALLRRVRKLP